MGVGYRNSATVKHLFRFISSRQSKGARLLQGRAPVAVFNVTLLMGIELRNVVNIAWPQKPFPEQSLWKILKHAMFRGKQYSFFVSSYLPLDALIFPRVSLQLFIVTVGWQR